MKIFTIFLTVALAIAVGFWVGFLHVETLSFIHLSSGLIAGILLFLAVIFSMIVYSVIGGDYD